MKKQDDTKVICPLKDTCAEAKGCNHSKPHKPYNWCDCNLRCYDQITVKAGEPFRGIVCRLVSGKESGWIVL